MIFFKHLKEWKKEMYRYVKWQFILVTFSVYSAVNFKFFTFSFFNPEPET
jgi:hypothetical protein